MGKKWPPQFQRKAAAGVHGCPGGGGGRDQGQSEIHPSGSPNSHPKEAKTQMKCLLQYSPYMSVFLSSAKSFLNAKSQLSTVIHAVRKKRLVLELPLYLVVFLRQASVAFLHSAWIFANNALHVEKMYSRKCSIYRRQTCPYLLLLPSCQQHKSPFGFYAPLFHYHKENVTYHLPRHHLRCHNQRGQTKEGLLSVITNKSDCIQATERLLSISLMRDTSH